MDWKEWAIPLLKELENLLKEKPYIKNVICKILKTHLPNGNLEFIEEALDNCVHDSTILIRCLVAGVKEEDFYSTLMELGFELSFVEWISEASLIYGPQCYKLYRIYDNGYDWDSLQPKLVLNQVGKYKLRIDIERIDSEHLIIEADRESYLKLIHQLIKVNDNFFIDPLTEDEKEVYEDIVRDIELLNKKQPE